VQTEAYLNAAESLAAKAITSGTLKLACDPAKLTNTADEDACATALIQSFGKRAFRRPVVEEDVTRLMRVFHEGRTGADFLTGIRLVVTTVLMSPQFLYRVELGLPAPNASDVAPLDSYEMATRLSYLLWSSMPDDALLAAADAGELTTREQVRAQVTRMLADPRAHEAIAHFNEQWLQLEKIGHAEKEAKVYPRFTPAIAQAMQQEATRFIEDVMWGPNGDLTTLLTATYTYMNAELAQFYGMSGPAGTQFSRVELDPTHRSGLLTLGGVLAAHSKADQSSPVFRGKFIREQLLCGEMPPPPADVPELPAISPNLTTRERLKQHSTDPACYSCHRLMDPIGFGLEKFDGIGLFRETESGKPIDDSGEIQDSDVSGAFKGPKELGSKLTQSLFAQKCVVTSWFHYAYARLEAVEDQCTVKTLVKRFADSKFRFQDLVIALTEMDAFRYRRVAAGGGQ
jgi:hypothetical protein